MKGMVDKCDQDQNLLDGNNSIKDDWSEQLYVSPTKSSYELTVMTQTGPFKLHYGIE